MSYQMTSFLQKEHNIFCSWGIYCFLILHNSSYKIYSHARSLIATCGNYTQVHKCVNVFPDLYKSYPVAYLKYYHAIMKYSNAACLLPAQWGR